MTFNVLPSPVPVLSASAAPAVALVPAAGTVLLEVLEVLGIVAGVGAGAYGISQGYPYIADMFYQSGLELEEWAENTFGGIYYTDGNSKYYVGNSTTFPVTDNSAILAHASALIDEYELPVNLTGKHDGYPIAGPANSFASYVKAVVPVGSLYGKWLVPFFIVGPSGVNSTQTETVVGHWRRMIRFRVDTSGIDSWSWGADEPVVHNGEMPLKAGYEPLFTFMLPDSGASQGLIYNYTKTDGYSNYLNFQNSNDYMYNFANRFSPSFSYRAFYDYDGKGISSSSVHAKNGTFKDGVIAIGTIKQYAVLVCNDDPTWSLGLTAKKEELGVDIPEDAVIVIEKTNPPVDPGGDDDDDDPDPEFYPPDWWKIIEDLMDYRGDTVEYPTTVNYYINNNFTFNTTVNPDVPRPSDFNVYVKFSGDVNYDIDADVNLGGNVDININININDSVSLPSVSEGDGENFFGADALDVFAGLTKNNPIMATLTALFGVIDPALVATFSVTISLCFLLAIWRLIRRG